MLIWIVPVVQFHYLTQIYIQYPIQKCKYYGLFARLNLYCYSIVDYVPL